MLLDTHVWVWAAEGQARHIGRRARRHIERAREARRLFVSTVSIFELAALHAAGRLQLAQPLEAWIRASIEHGSLRLSDLALAMAVDAGAIPASALPDPVDRMLAATARQLGVPLMTRDRRVLDYAHAIGLVKVVDAGL